MTLYDLLARHTSPAAVGVAVLVLLGLLLRLVALPLALAALLTGRLVTALDSAVTARPAPPRPPRWAAANTRTRHTATV